MKYKHVKITLICLLAVVSISFSPRFGGEGYEIFINNKAVIQQYGKSMDKPTQLRVDRRSVNDQLTVKYHHCGRVAKKRMISLRNDQNHLLKEWRFADVDSPMDPMHINMNDIVKLNSPGVYRLNYASSELSHGRLLTTILVENRLPGRK